MLFLVLHAAFSVLIASSFQVVYFPLACFYRSLTLVTGQLIFLCVCIVLNILSGIQIQL